MKTVYAIAYMTEDEDGAKDLYVETLIADSRAASAPLRPRRTPAGGPNQKPKGPNQ